MSGMAQRTGGIGRACVGQPGPRCGSGAFDALVALCGCVAIAGVLVLTNYRMWHWFVLPVTACGALIGRDAVRWLRGAYDTFDPKGLIGLVGIHIFFLAPVLQVYWDVPLPFAENPPDWRPFLGAMAILNLAGLLAYTLGQAVGLAPRRPRAAARRMIDARKLFQVLLVFIPVAALAEMYVFARVGGLSGLVRPQAVTAKLLVGTGWILTLGESLPLLCLIGLLFLGGSTRRRRASFAALGALLVAFLVLQFFIGGLRGSRSNTVWAVLWALGIVHFFRWRIPARAMLLAVVPFLAFMFFYSFYKDLGAEALTLLGGRSRDPLSSVAVSRLARIVVADLSRAGTQALILYRQTDCSEPYEYALGATYLGDAAILIPRFVWPGRPPTKVKAGTEIQHGRGSYVADQMYSHRVYGLGGEAMLNFGVLGIPLAYAVWGFLVGRYRRRFLSWQSRDARLLLAPFACILCIVALAGDLDNLIFSAVKNGLVPFLVVWWSSSRVAVANAEGAGTD